MMRSTMMQGPVLLHAVYGIAPASDRNDARSQSTLTRRQAACPTVVSPQYLSLNRICAVSSLRAVAKLKRTRGVGFISRCSGRIEIHIRVLAWFNALKGLLASAPLTS